MSKVLCLQCYGGGDAFGPFFFALPLTDSVLVHLRDRAARLAAARAAYPELSCIKEYGHPGSWFEAMSSGYSPDAISDADTAKLRAIFADYDFDGEGDEVNASGLDLLDGLRRVINGERAHAIVDEVLIPSTDNVRTESNYMRLEPCYRDEANVSFSFSCEIKHTDVTIRTESFTLSDLNSWLTEVDIWNDSSTAS